MCGHSVCHECLTKLPLRGQVILCPFDRQPTQIGDSGIWGLKKNFALLDLLERLQVNKDTVDIQETDDFVRSVRCDEDEKHVASVYCTICSTNLCDECSKSTHSTKTLSKHKRVPVAEKPKDSPPCPSHPNHVLEFACLEDSCRDNPLLCYVCKDYGKHQGHKHVLLESEAEAVRSSVIGAVQHVKVFSEEVAEYMKKLSTATESIEGMKGYKGFTLILRESIPQPVVLEKIHLVPSPIQLLTVLNEPTLLSGAFALFRAVLMSCLLRWSEGKN